MTERDIQASFLALRNIVAEMAGADMPEKEKQVVKQLSEIALNLLEGLLIDINRLAEAAQYLADAEHQK